MAAHAIGTCYEHKGANNDGQKVVTGQFTGAATYDLGGSVLDLSTVFADEVRGAWIQDTVGEWVGLYVNAAANAPATGKVIVKGVSWDDVVLAHDATCFDAAATSDNDDVWTQPNNSELLGIRTTLTEKFVAASMTALTIEVGDTGAADANAFYAGSADLVADAVDSVTVGPGAEIGISDGTVPAYLATGAARKLTCSATGANLSTTSAGSVTLRFYFSPLTAQGYAPKGMGEVHSGQVLSGSTFNFIAWGTDA